MATGSKFPHDLKPDEVFYHKGKWVTADFIAIGRPSTAWVTVHLKEREGQVVPVIMLKASERVLVIVPPDKAKLRDRYENARRVELRNKSRRTNWR